MSVRVKVISDNPIEFNERKIECSAISMTDLRVETLDVKFTDIKQEAKEIESANNFPYTFPITF